MKEIFFHSWINSDVFGGYSIADCVESMKLGGVSLPCQEAILGPELDWFGQNKNGMVSLKMDSFGKPFGIKTEPMIDKVHHHQQGMVQNAEVLVPQMAPMESFPQEKVTDFKHIIYNLLVENHNSRDQNSFVRPCQLVDYDGEIRTGFCFNEELQPDKRLPEMYAQHIRKAPKLELENQSSIFIQDLYKFYLRACVELLSKYFDKRGKYTYLYDDTPLFVEGGSLEEAEARIKHMKTRARKKRKN